MSAAGPAVADAARPAFPSDQPPSLPSAGRPPSDRPSPGLWAAASLLFAIACFDDPLYLRAWESLPPVLREHFTPSFQAAATFTALKASLFLAGLLALCAPHVLPVWRQLRRQAAADDLRQALAACLGLLALVFTTRCSSLGIDYQLHSLDPFLRQANALNRRLLEIALAYYLHLNGALFILFHFLLVLGALMLVRQFFRRQGITLGLLELTSLGTASFLMHDFQYPGYPDILVVVLALLMLTVDLPARGRVVLTLLALLSHEALAFAVFLPLAWRLPAADRRGMLAAMALYLLFWAAEFGFDLRHGFFAQVHYSGYSGPTLLMQRPWIVLFGILMAYKLLWLPLAAHLAGSLRRQGWRAALREAAPVAAGIGLCLPSFDTSRVAGMGFVTLLFALARLWPRLDRRKWRLLFAANLLLPSLYVSPVIDQPLGTAWMAGLYAAYNGFRLGTPLLPPVLPPPP